MKFRNKAVIFFATGGWIGHIPLAPGTFGSLVGLGVCFGLAQLSPLGSIVGSIIIVLFAIWMADEAEKLLAQKDPGKIVIDEIAGMAVTIIGIPFSVTNAAIAFLFFRIYDIAKPFPIRLLERKLRGGLGVVMDDVLAGVFANLTLRLLLLIRPTVG